ncbi:MAG: DUF1801 domain-containing protein [Saprospiraceae bacterium]|nr:DUF1801 domain-containing protein [Pyrinomonadaceae bacterium]
MRSDKSKFENIDEYIAGFPADVQEILQKIRIIILKAAPEAEEAISYQIPTFKLRGKNVIHFAGFKNHIGIYPAPRGVAEFDKEMSKYKGGKGTVQFQLDEPIPYGLITRIVKFRINMQV